MSRFLSDLRYVLNPATLARVARKLLANDGMAFAGQLAYFFMLFLFPFLVLLVSLTGLLIAEPESLLKSVTARTEGFLPQSTIEILRNYLDRTLQSTSSSTFLLSGLLTIVTGWASTEAIIIAANRFYDVPETRSLWKRGGISGVLIFGFALLVATMAFLVLSPQTGAYLQQVIGFPESLVALWGPLSWMIAFVNLALAFDILYYVAPNVDLSFRWITPGGLTTIILLLISNKIFIFWASDIFRYNALYGQLGIGIVLLIWLYITGLVLLAGIEINAELARADGENRRNQSRSNQPGTLIDGIQHGKGRGE